MFQTKVTQAFAPLELAPAGKLNHRSRGLLPVLALWDNLVAIKRPPVCSYTTVSANLASPKERISMFLSKFLSKRSFPVAFLAAAALTATPALIAQKKADLTNLVVVGDSLSAGYQNSQLIETSQVHGYANVVATQAGVDLNLPLLPAPGFPQISPGPYPETIGLSFVPRTNNDQTRDVAVPGFTVGALVEFQPPCTPAAIPVPVFVQVLASEILNPTCAVDPGPTELTEAVLLAPSTAILWIGSNDALLPILFGEDATDLPTFGFLQNVAESTLASASGSLVVANIPDVTLLPYMTSVDRLAQMLGLPVPFVEKVFGLNHGDLVTPYAFALIEAMGGSLTLLPDSIADGPVIIRAAAVAQIRDTVVAYNAIIAEQAASNGAVLVDLYALVNDLAAHGKVVNGQKLTTEFLGGLFSYDGIHPTNTGYAIIADEFIKVMNRTLGARIPPISIEQVAKTDPLIFPPDHKHNGYVDKAMADALRAVMAH